MGVVPRELKSSLFVIAAGMCWGMTGTVQAFAPEGATSLTIGSARVFCAGLLLFIWALITRGASFVSGNWRISGICLSAFGLTAYQLAFFSAVRLTGVTIGTMIAIGTAPALAGIIGRFLFRERLSRRWYIATLLAVTGCTLLVSAGNKNFTSVSIQGVILAFCAALSYAIEGAGLRIAGEHDPLDTVTIISILSGLISLPWLIIGDTSWIWQPKGLMCVFILAVLTTILPLTLFTKGIRGITLGEAYTLSLSEPLSAWFLSTLLLGERLSILGFLGVLILLSGIITLTWKNKE